MIEAPMPMVGLGPGASISDGPCGYSCSLSVNAFNRMIDNGMDQAKALSYEAKNLGTAVTENGFQFPIGIFTLQAAKVKFFDKVKGVEREEETLVDYDTGTPMAVYTDAGENSTGTPESYCRMLKFAHQLATTSGPAEMFWTSPEHAVVKRAGESKAEHRALRLRKNKDGVVTGYQYQLTGSVDALERMMTKLGYSGTHEKVSVENQVVIRRGENVFSHSEIFRTYESSLLPQEKAQYGNFLTQFRKDTQLADKQLQERVDYFVRIIEPQLQKEYIGDIQSTINKAAHGVIALINDSFSWPSQSLQNNKYIKENSIRKPPPDSRTDADVNKVADSHKGRIDYVINNVKERLTVDKAEIDVSSTVETMGWYEVAVDRETYNQQKVQQESAEQAVLAAYDRMKKKEEKKRQKQIVVEEPQLPNTHPQLTADGIEPPQKEEDGGKTRSNTENLVPTETIVISANVQQERLQKIETPQLPVKEVIVPAAFARFIAELTDADEFTIYDAVPTDKEIGTQETEGLKIPENEVVLFATFAHFIASLGDDDLSVEPDMYSQLTQGAETVVSSDAMVDGTKHKLTAIEHSGDVVAVASTETYTTEDKEVDLEHDTNQQDEMFPTIAAIGLLELMLNNTQHVDELTESEIVQISTKATQSPEKINKREVLDHNREHIDLSDEEIAGMSVIAKYVAALSTKDDSLGEASPDLRDREVKTITVDYTEPLHDASLIARVNDAVGLVPFIQFLEDTEANQKFATEYESIETPPSNEDSLVEDVSAFVVGMMIVAERPTEVKKSDTTQQDAVDEEQSETVILPVIATVHVLESIIADTSILLESSQPVIQQDDSKSDDVLLEKGETTSEIKDTNTEAFVEGLMMLVVEDPSESIESTQLQVVISQALVGLMERDAEDETKDNDDKRVEETIETAGYSKKVNEVSLGEVDWREKTVLKEKSVIEAYMVGLLVIANEQDDHQVQLSTTQALVGLMVPFIQSQNEERKEDIPTIDDLIESIVLSMSRHEHTNQNNPIENDNLLSEEEEEIHEIINNSESNEIIGQAAFKLISQLTAMSDTDFTPVPESPPNGRGDEWESSWGFRYGVSSLILRKPRPQGRGGFTHTEDLVESDFSKRVIDVAQEIISKKIPAGDEIIYVRLKILLAAYQNETLPPTTKTIITHFLHITVEQLPQYQSRLAGRYGVGYRPVRYGVSTPTLESLAKLPADPAKRGGVSLSTTQEKIPDLPHDEDVITSIQQKEADRIVSKLEKQTIKYLLFHWVKSRTSKDIPEEQSSQLRLKMKHTLIKMIHEYVHKDHPTRNLIFQHKFSEEILDTLLLLLLKKLETSQEELEEMIQLLSINTKTYKSIVKKPYYSVEFLPSFVTRSNHFTAGSQYLNSNQLPMFDTIFVYRPLVPGSLM